MAWKLPVSRADCNDESLSSVAWNRNRCWYSMCLSSSLVASMADRKDPTGLMVCKSSCWRAVICSVKILCVSFSRLTRDWLLAFILFRSSRKPCSVVLVNLSISACRLGIFFTPLLKLSMTDFQSAKLLSAVSLVLLEAERNMAC